MSPEVKFVFLRQSRARSAEQLKGRRGHFMNPELLDSQFSDLEQAKPSEDVLVIELGGKPNGLVHEIKTKLRI